MSDNMNDKIFEFAYELALRDATMMKAYDGEKTSLRNNTDAEKILKEYIGDIIGGKNPDFYSVASSVEKSFCEFIETQKENKKENEKFTFGNTQKLINMTVKYMYIATYNNKELRKNFKCCHCPLDRKMRDEIWSKIKDKEIDGCEKEINYLREKGFKNCVWSKLESPEGFYNAFQKIVRHIEKDGNPIEFDYKNWSPSEEKKEDKQ